MNGRYVEYAFRPSAEANARTVCGVWWSDATEPVAAYLPPSSNASAPSPAV